MFKGVLTGGVIIKKQNNIILIGIILCIFLTISAVAATDNTTLNTNTNSTNDISINNITTINQGNNVENSILQDNNLNTVNIKQLSPINNQYQSGNQDPQPTIAINSSGEISSTTGQPVFLNESFTFNLNFNVENGSATGWSPTIELYVPNNITITDASYLGYNVILDKIGTFNSKGEGVIDPFTNTAISNLNYANYTLYTLSYPIGSFTTGTDGAIMNIKALLSGNATVGDIQKIYATPLFKYKSEEFLKLSPVFGTQITGYIDPTVMTVDKNTTLHDWETATGPNYPYPYYIDVDIANGKTVNNITLNDIIPNQLMFLNVTNITINGVTYTKDDFASQGITVTEPDKTYTGGNLIVNFEKLTGTNSSVDARVWFYVYAPEFDNNTIRGTNLTIINNNTGAANVTVNNVTCTGTYNGKKLTDKSNITVTLRSLAIQKGVNGYGWGSEIGLNSYLNYTAYFQVSDYFDIGNMTITDVFGTILDQGSAQVFNASQPVTLTITVQGTSHTYSLTQENGGYVLINNTNGTQDVIFYIGKILTNNTIFNITNLTGGLYDNRLNNVGNAIGTLNFGVNVGTKYTNSSNIKDGVNTNEAINGGDSVNNHVSINGKLFNNNYLVTDTGGTHLVITTPSINKTIYAVNGNTDYKNNATAFNTTNGDVLAHSGDNITYMLNFTIPTGTEKSLNITDNLPIPFYNSTQFITVVGVGTNSTTGIVPTAGHWAYGTDTNLLKNNESAIINPSFIYNDTTNYIKWMFGDTYSNAESHTVILLYTVTVTDVIIPDSVYKTNRATLAFDTTSIEYNSNQTIAMVFTQFPDLCINKTVNTTSSVMNGTNVTYTIIVNNTGHGAAFNVTVVDNFTNLNIADNASVINSLKVVYSNGTSITLSDDDKKAFFNGTGLLIKELASESYLNITYEAVFNENLIPNTNYVNTANITSYYADTSENATNFVNDTNDIRYHDIANVTATSLNFTKTYVGSNDTAKSYTNLTIGETGIWYLNVTLPQNLNVTNFSIIDTLPVGFMYTNLTITTTSDSPELIEFLKHYTITNTSNKINITFTNPIYPTSAGENFTVTLYSVVTQNSSALYNNKNSTRVTNNGTINWADGKTNHTISKNANVNVIQPVLNVTKNFNPETLINDYSNATIVIKNIGSTTAFNVTIFDNMTMDDSDFNEADWNATVYYPNNTISVVAIKNGVLSFDAGNLTPGQNITIKYNMTLDNFQFLVGSIYNNTVSVNYSSMNDSYPYRANYTTNASALLKTDLTTLTKILTNTSFDTTNGNNLVIGEVATFNLTFVLSRGDYQNLTLSDNLPAGMVLVPGSIRVLVNNDNFNGTLNNITIIATNNSSFKILFYTNSENNITQSLIMDNNVTITYNATLTNASTNKNGVSLVNHANVNWTKEPGGHNATTTVTVVEPNLGINKTANMTNLNIGENFTYNITVFHTSTSKANATNVTIKDTLPDGIYFTNTSDYKTVNGVEVNFKDNKTVIITIDSLALGLTQSIILQTGVENNISLAGTNITNVANVTYTDYTGNRTYNATNNTKVHVLNVDLVITKTNTTNVVAGQNVTYAINVINNGPDTAYNVIVNDKLPSMLENVTYTYNGGTVKVNGDIASINIGTLTKGQTVTITVTGFIPANTVDANITNYANVTSTTTENVTTNNNVSITNNLTKDVDIQVNKTVNNTNPAYNDIITYTIVVRNNGPDTALNVIVNEVLPNGLILKSYNTTIGTFDKITGIWSVGDLGNDTNATLTIIALVNKTGNLTNTVNTTTTSNDTNSSNNNATVNITVNSTADLSITKIANINSLYPGNQFTYTITVTNNGPDNATGVKVNDILPNGLTYVSSNSTDYNSNTGVWNIGNLASGNSTSLTITVTAVNIGAITNVANVTGNENETTYTNNNASVTVNVISTDLFINKTVNNANPEMGDVIDYTIIVGNNGPYDATGVKVKEILPDGLIYVMDTSNGTYDSTTGIWNIGNLANGQKVTLNIMVLVNKTGNIINIVNVTGNEPETNTGNNNFTANITVPPMSDLSITKVANVTNATKYGSNSSYIITVTNNGVDNATGVKVNDNLPAGLIYVSDNSNGAYDSTTGIWTIGNLSVGQSVSLTIIVKINVTGNITNFADVNGTNYDPNMSNNHANVTINIPAYVDLSINETVSNPTPKVGDIVTWTVTIRNNGPDNDTGVRVHDLMPNIKFLKALVSKGYYNATSDEWYVGDFNVGDTATLVLTTQVISTGTFTLPTTVVGNDNETTYSNNNATASIVVINGNNSTNGTNHTPHHPVNPNVPHYSVGPNHSGLTPAGSNDGSLLTAHGSNGVNMPKTGNPILALLLILSVLVGIRPFRKNRK